MARPRRFHEGVEYFFYDAFTGRRKELLFDAYKTMPVDLNGDGRHELVLGHASGEGMVFDRNGTAVGRIEGTVAMPRKLLDLPGYERRSFRCGMRRRPNDVSTLRARAAMMSLSTEFAE
ncbi:MAG: hypothetical protein GF331_14150 [Chitinivibrionales bacterium]|nr:hypothetical protein [Chitinivibrionales bacterium]